MPRPRRILIVDDSFVSRAELEEAFRERGYEVDTAADGAEGLARVEQGLPDIVMIDAVMPNIDGWELCRRLRSRASSDQLSIIAMSSKDASTTSLQASEAGADEFFQKPMDVDELFESVDRLLAARGL